MYINNEHFTTYFPHRVLNYGYDSASVLWLVLLFICFQYLVAIIYLLIFEFFFFEFFFFEFFIQAFFVDSPLSRCQDGSEEEGAGNGALTYNSE